MAAKSKPNRRQDRPVRRLFSIREQLVAKLGHDQAEEMIAQMKPKRRRRRR